MENSKKIIKIIIHEQEEKLLAPNGNISNLPKELYYAVRTIKFKKWFGDWENNSNNSSKVVDANGEPMVVYHTSNNDFSEFDKNKIGKNYTLRHGNGFYFSTGTLGHKQWGSNTKMFFLNIKNHHYHLRKRQKRRVF